MTLNKSVEHYGITTHSVCDNMYVHGKNGHCMDIIVWTIHFACFVHFHDSVMAGSQCGHKSSCIGGAVVLQQRNCHSTSYIQYGIYTCDVVKVCSSRPGSLL